MIQSSRVYFLRATNGRKKWGSSTYVCIKYDNYDIVFNRQVAFLVSADNRPLPEWWVLQVLRDRLRVCLSTRYLWKLV